MNKEMFSVELLDELDVAAGGEVVVSDKIVDQLRWADVHEIVFRMDNDKFWMVNYYEGSTEYQESGWDYGDQPTMVEAVEVEPYEVTVTKFRPVQRD